LKNSLLYIALFFVATSLVSCNKEEENKSIPSAPVSFVIDVSPAGADYELNGSGVCKIYTDDSPATCSPGCGAYGYSGVAVIRSVIDEKLYAFDICCPYEAQKGIALKNDGYFLKCSNCGSQFSIGNGTGAVYSGPSTQPLKTYNVYRSSEDLYRVTN